MDSEPFSMKLKSGSINTTGRKLISSAEEREKTGGTRRGN